MSQEETKEAVKEAVKEWLDERYADLGKSVLRWILGIALAGLVFLFFKTGGFKIG